MANTITVNGNAGVTTDGLSINNAIGYTITMNGYAVEAAVQDIALGSWQALSTSSLSDIRVFAASNESPVTNQSGSIKISTSGTGTPVIAILWSGDSCVIPWSGSVGFWAQAFTTASVLQYFVAES
jgi:hypothetical protein